MQPKKFLKPTEKKIEHFNLGVVVVSFGPLVLRQALLCVHFCKTVPSLRPIGCEIKPQCLFLSQENQLCRDTNYCVLALFSPVLRCLYDYLILESQMWALSYSILSYYDLYSCVMIESDAVLRWLSR